MDRGREYRVVRFYERSQIKVDLSLEVSIKRNRGCVNGNKIEPLSKLLISGFLIMRKIPRDALASCHRVFSESFEIVLFSIDKALFFVRSKLSRDYLRPRRRTNKRKMFNSALLLVYSSIRITLYSDCSFASISGWKFLDSWFMKRPRRWNSIEI